MALVVAIGAATLVNRLATPGPAHPTSSLRHPGIGGVTAPAGASQLHAPLAAFMGATALHRAKAPAWTLTDPVTGTAVSLATLRGQVVVLSFADAACDDMCPVLGRELAAASADLSTRDIPVAFVTINTDPLQTAAGARAAVVASGDFATVPGWRFLTGSLRALDRVWAAYGISITADKSSRRVSHNELLYVIGPDQTLRESVIPYADESPSGAYSLTAPVVARFARGLAGYVEQAAR